MSYFIIDKRDRLAQRVTESADEPTEPRYVKVFAGTVREAFELAGVGPMRPKSEERGS